VNPHPRSTTRDARRALGLAWAIGFMMWGLLLAVDAVLPTIQAELGLSFTVRSLVLALPFLSMALFAIPGGYLADRHGVQRSVTLGGVIAVAGAGLRAISGRSEVLLLGAAVFGLGLGIVIPNLPKLVSTRYGSSGGGLATGIYSTGLIAGSVSGVYLTGPLAEALDSWQNALAVWAAAAAVVVAAWGLLLSDGKVHSPATPLGYRVLLRRRELWLLALVFAAGNASYFFLVGTYPQILTHRGLSLDDAFGQLTVLIGVGVPAIFLAPVLSDRTGLRRPFLWGPHVLIAALLLVLPAVSQDALPLVSVGLGFSEMAVFAIALLLPVDLFAPDEIGRGSGVVISIAYVGALAGPLGAGISVDQTQAFDVALSAFALLSVVSVLAVFALPETGRRRRP